MITLNTVRADIANWRAEKFIEAQKKKIQAAAVFVPLLKSTVPSPSPSVQRAATPAQ